MSRSGYDAIAHFYDALVTTDVDLAFFERLAAECRGPVLELMAGTGRVTMVLHRATVRLTCLDASARMLEELCGKFAGATQPPLVVCGDVRALPLKAGYELALIPFNAFAELTDPGDQYRALAEAHRALAPGGRLVCTLHNPIVRAGSLDGVSRLYAKRRFGGGRRLEAWVRGNLEAPGLAESVQTYRVLDPNDTLLEEHMQTTRFALIAPESFLRLAEAAGFVARPVLGDYDGTPFAAATSPYMIWTLDRP